MESVRKALAAAVAVVAAGLPAACVGSGGAGGAEAPPQDTEAPFPPLPGAAASRRCRTAADRCSPSIRSVGEPP